MYQGELDGFLPEPDYGAISDFRYRIRKFLRYMDEHIRDTGLEPQQYFLLLALKGWPAGRELDVCSISERLQINDAAVQTLLASCAEQGLIVAGNGAISLTPGGLLLVRKLATFAQEELCRMAPEVTNILFSLELQNGQVSGKTIKPETSNSLKPGSINAGGTSQHQRHIGRRCRR